jgi:hypothetical protein
MIYTILISVSAFIFSWLMLASSEFSKWIAYIRIACGIKGPCIFIPVIGIPISLLATIAGIIWYLLIARTLIKIGWQ